jgi:hypothetical protein
MQWANGQFLWRSERWSERAGSAGLRVGHDALPRVKQGRQTAR